MKTGACRYGFQCKRRHIYPVISETILIDHMYRDKYSDSRTITNSLDDILLEVFFSKKNLKYDHKEMQEGYNTFFEDCIPEFEKFGKILQFKVKFLVNYRRLAIILCRILGETFLSSMKMRWMLSRRCLSWRAGNFSWA